MGANELMALLWPSAMTVQAVYVAAKLGIADLVADGPKTIAELADVSGSHAPSLERLLRALGSYGIFARDATGRYAQTPLSDALRADHPQSMRPLAMMVGAGFMWKPTGELALTVETGEPAFEHVFKTQFFKHLAAHENDAAVFNQSMSSLPAYLTAIVEAYDFSGLDRIVDIGGGHGALLAAILTAHPGAHGVLYDLPGVLSGAPARPELGGRLEIVAGDFFESVPGPADAYVLKGIIHDWNDASALAILRNCRRVIPEKGRLLIVDNVLTTMSDAGPAMMDLLMMVLTGGRERTEPEFRALLAEAGFALTSVIPTTGHSILDSRPI